MRKVVSDFRASSDQYGQIMATNWMVEKKVRAKKLFFLLVSHPPAYSCPLLHHRAGHGAPRDAAVPGGDGGGHHLHRPGEWADEDKCSKSSILTGSFLTTSLALALAQKRKNQQEKLQPRKCSNFGSLAAWI